MVAKVGEEWGKDGLGVWDQWMQTIIYRLNKQQGPTIVNIMLINNNGKEYLHICVCVCVCATDLPCCTTKMNTLNKIN